MTRDRQPFFYGWWVALTAALGLFLGVAPIFVFSFSVFLKAFTQEFHATRAGVSLAFTLHNLVSAFTAPFAGRLIDRFGSRRIILPTTVIFGSILLLTLFFTRTLWEIYLFYMVTGVFGCGSGPVAYGSTVARWFDKRRGLALAVMMLGIGIGATVMPSLVQRLIVNFGWRAAFASYGCAVLVVALPVVKAFLKDNPSQMGLLPDGATFAPVTTDGASSGLTWPEARRSRSFWLMVGAFFLLGASVHASVLHLAAMLTDRGISGRQAALASSLTGVALLMGRITAGALMDRYFAPLVAVFFSTGVAVGILVLAFGHSTPLAFTGAFLVGLGMGAEADIIAYLTSRYCGLRAFGEIYGYAFAAFVIAGALGTLLMGVGFDRTGAYVVSLTGFFCATSVAAILFGLLGPYKYGVRQFDPTVAAMKLRQPSPSCSP
jgi:MFS family permease